ncbi:PepSY-associated TM helix domain-containing protein [Psychrobacter sp. ANT_H3]|uniref:PepSY-associated TM helix domain-containing protein n=1 Tax=Psychrobacter sp. ANT_H3 TaxID=3019444 RepID=UPI0022F196BF|nr:PepSY-associated TM helix domain-containing protein [Psychrobacter sp. ANT_H3]MDA5134343.1 PepSY-associated TM helix domain-containing protein [Psychrobacter sp. ANT_H3]
MTSLSLSSFALNMRRICLLIHRYTGLVMAGFLIIAGFTGSLLAFHDELDNVFNHQLAQIKRQDAPQLPIATLHDKVAAAYPEYNFSSMPTSLKADKSAVFSVDRVRGQSARNQPKAPFQEVYINPYNGDIVGTRDKDEWAWRNTMWKVFWLHRDLLLGDIGKLLLGVIALLWTINCFIGFYLTLPRTVKKSHETHRKTVKKRASFIKRWLSAWKIRRKTNTFKLNYDVHHAFGLWLWLMLFVIAWSSVGFNLKSVYQPVMQVVVGLQSRESREGKEGKEGKEREKGKSHKSHKFSAQVLPNVTPVINATADIVNKANSIEYVSKQANIAAQKNGVTVQQLLSIRWVAEDNQWQMRFKTDKDIGTHSGASSITVDAATGKVEKVNFGYQCSFGTKADRWLSTLHMGHISHGIGHLAYQIFLALIGLAVVVLSGTGVYLWAKGRQQRLKVLQKLR